MPSKKREIRYVKYLRVSSERQDVENSLSAQDAAADRYVEANGGKIIRTYKDEAKSGKIEHRPGFQQMIQDAADPAKTFDAILIWKFNRFARNRRVSITYKSMLDELGIKVISINENTGDGPAGRMVEGIIESVDEYTSANMAEDIKRGMRNSVERGFYLASTPPTGYKIVHVRDGGKHRPKLELDPPWDLLPRRAFQLALRDYGLKSIRHTLIQEGFRTQSGAIPSITLIHRILRNPHYTGYTFWDYRGENDNYAKSHQQAHDAIVSPAEWELVQAKMASRRPQVKHPRTLATDHLFNDIGTCAKCNHKISIKGSDGNKKYYFVCANRFKNGRSACDLPRYPVSENDPIILEAIISHTLDAANLRKLIDFVRSDTNTDARTAEQKLADLDVMFDNLDSREERLLTALEMQAFSTERIRERASRINEERQTLERLRQSIIDECDTEASYLSDPDLIVAYAKDIPTYLCKSNVKSANAMLQRFIESIVFEEGFVTINYKIPLPDGTPVGEHYHKVALKTRVRPTVAGGPADDMDQRLMEAVLDDILSESHVRDAIARIRALIEEHSASELKEIKTIERSLADLETQAERLMIAYETGKVPLDLWSKRMDSINERKDALTQSKNTVDRTTELDLQFVNHPDHAFYMAEELRQSLLNAKPARLKIWLRTFVKRVRFDYDKAIIDYAFPLPDASPRPGETYHIIDLDDPVNLSVPSGPPSHRNSHIRGGLRFSVFYTVHCLEEGAEGFHRPELTTARFPRST